MRSSACITKIGSCNSDNRTKTICLSRPNRMFASSTPRPPREWISLEFLMKQKLICTGKPVRESHSPHHCAVVTQFYFYASIDSVCKSAFHFEQSALVLRNRKVAASNSTRSTKILIRVFMP